MDRIFQNVAWHCNVFNPDTLRTEGPKNGFPEFVFRINPESDLQGLIVRALLITVEYYCDIEYINLELPPRIERPLTLQYQNGPPWKYEANGNNNIPWNENFAPITPRNHPIGPIGIIGHTINMNWLMEHMLTPIPNEPSRRAGTTDFRTARWVYGDTYNYPPLPETEVPGVALQSKKSKIEELKRKYKVV